MCNLKPQKQNSALCKRLVSGSLHGGCGGLLTSLLTFTGLVPALLTTHSQLHWLHSAADSWLGSSGNCVCIVCHTRKGRDQQPLAICTVLCVSYTNMSKDLQV